MEFKGIDFAALPRPELRSKVESAMSMARAQLDKLAAQPEAPTFANTLGELERTLEPVQRALSLFFNLHSADSDEDLKAQAADVSRLATEFQSSLYFNKNLFQRGFVSFLPVRAPVHPPCGGPYSRTRQRLFQEW